LGSKNLTKQDCQKILFKVGIKFGVSPKLISERLLDAQDKCDMLNGEVPIEYLEVAVQAWMAAGMPDYASGLSSRMDEVKKGSNRPLARQTEPGKVSYRKPFVEFSEPLSSD
jgi:hypothetical protein